MVSKLLGGTVRPIIQATYSINWESLAEKEDIRSDPLVLRLVQWGTSNRQRVLQALHRDDCPALGCFINNEPTAYWRTSRPSMQHQLQEESLYRYRGRQNKSANTVPRDALHRLDQDVLYCQNVTQFHGTQVNGISFLRMKKVRPAMWWFLWNSHMLNPSALELDI